MYQWTYGVAMSGLMVPLTTASGTYAKNFAATSLSAVISKDATAWQPLSGRIATTPGEGVYSITSLSSTEMQCYTWAVKVTANSGTVGNVLLGYNMSGPVMTSDISGFAHSIDCSGNNNILTAVSGLKNDVSGLPGILTASSAPVVLRGINHTSAQIAIVDAATNVSNLVYASGLNGLLATMSTIPNAVRDINTATATSGTLAHDVKLCKYFTWHDMVIDKTGPTYKQYHFDGTNVSASFELTDDASYTKRTRV